MSWLLRIKRWFNTRALHRRGAQMFGLRGSNRDDRRLYLRELYWLYRSWGMPHAEALSFAIKTTVGHMRLQRASDALDSTINKLVETLNKKKGVA